MRGLTKALVREWEDYQASLSRAFVRWQEIAEKWNDVLGALDVDAEEDDRRAAVEHLLQQAEEAWDDLTVAHEDAQSWATSIVEAADDYAAERTEKWQESEAGQDYLSWIDEWRSWAEEPLYSTLPGKDDEITELEVPDDPAEALGNLRASPKD